MKVQIILGEQLEQVNVNQIINSQSQQIIISKLVNPSIFFKMQFMPGSFDVAIIVATQGMSSATEHNTRVFLRKLGSIDLLADTGNLPIPQGVFPDAEGLNLNIDFKKIAIREDGAYEVIATIDGDEYSQEFLVKGIEKLTA